MKLVDASVAMKWLVDEDGSEAAAELANTVPLVAPELLRAEVGNALVTKLRRGDINGEEVMSAFNAVGYFVARWIAMPTLADRALAIASNLRHPIYDCYYLAAAESEALELVTADQRLIAAVRDTEHARWVVPL